MPLGEVGEILVRGPSVCLGYLDDPESTERKFDGGWLRTGDLACRDAERILCGSKGEQDDFIKIRGSRVSVGEVEAKVGAIAGVSECAAVGVKHPEAGEALALLVVAERGVIKWPDKRRRLRRKSAAGIAPALDLRLGEDCSRVATNRQRQGRACPVSDLRLRPDMSSVGRPRVDSAGSVHC